MARIRGVTFTLVALSLINADASAVYFAMPTVDVTLPDLKDVQRPLPPLLKLQPLQGSPDDVKYSIDPNGPFSIRRNEVSLKGIGSSSLHNDLHEVKVYGRDNNGETESAILRFHFTDKKFNCDGLTKEMCFWTDGEFRIRQSQDPTQVAFLSSEFLLRLCNNYSVAYEIVSGDDYFSVSRVNGESWVLSLERRLDVGYVTVELVCTVSENSGFSIVYKKRFNVESLQGNDKSAVNGLEVMSLIVPSNERERMSITYPKFVDISRFATVAARVAEPSATIPVEAPGTGSDRERVLKSLADSGVKFTMQSEAFAVTEVGGIVYVLNPSLMRSTSVKITWIHANGLASSASMMINVSEDDRNVCGGSDKGKRSCSQKTFEIDCLKTCGVSTGFKNATGCRWRHNEAPERLSINYRTCSPDLSTCPDRYCDPLEKEYPEVCPQDCAESVYGSGNKENGLGISSASGVCSCSLNGGAPSCTCDLPDWRKEQRRGRKSHKMDKSTKPPLMRHGDVNVSVVQAAGSDQCGVVCLSSVVGGSVIMVLAISTFLLILYHRRLKKRCPNQGPLKEDMININYEEYIDRPAEGIRVPPHGVTMRDKPDYYDKKWEFPRYRLTVEETIGEGEFGKVLKARAEGIKGIDGPTIVAVKTLKENARDSELADLVSEYQLLKEVDHPNIIHLLGACTTLDGPLYIIIEYAKHGSLRNYLRRNRNFGSELQLTDKESETSYVQSITPKDILTFAWQIAKGMAYLTEMKLVHRDLAARNVLVAEGLICKISDFGLTRDIYEDDTYLKRSKGRVPVKWMALESLSDHLYTTKSDVWSYGIVLWELVTTGASPYPGIAVQNLFYLLKCGYRMEKPTNCSEELYQILRSCWHENPSHRPTFKFLVSKLEEMLGEGKDYLDLNPRIIENRTYFTDIPDEPEREAFLQENCDRRGPTWKFDFTDGTAKGRHRYENEVPARKYENEGVQDSSYVEPKGEPKPVNALPEPVMFPRENLQSGSGEKKTCGAKKV